MLKIKNKVSMSSDYYIQTPNPGVPRCIAYKIPPAFPLDLYFIAITTNCGQLSFQVKLQVSAFSSQLLHLLYSPLTYVIHSVSSTFLFRESWYYFYAMYPSNFDSAMVSQQCRKLNISSGQFWAFGKERFSKSEYRLKLQLNQNSKSSK